MAKQFKDYLTDGDFLLKHIEKADMDFSKRLYSIMMTLYILTQNMLLW
jgi:hypothetical protein